MFTGIIESLGKILSMDKKGANKTFWIESPISNELKIDQSLSHNGVCLTVEEIYEGRHRVTAIRETLEVTNLDSWETGSLVNLERCLLMNGRLDGHMVQGHVDTTATCLELKELAGSWQFRLEFSKKFSPLIIEKGSICLNGISLTVFNVKKTRFDVAIIPYTYEHTNINSLVPGTRVNVEFDITGKYIARFTELKLR